MLIIGIVMIPYPGPGWLIVFAGLAILAKEFTWARRALDYTKDKYSTWQNWMSRQPFFIKVLAWSFTCLVVIFTVWLLNGYGFLNYWLKLDQDWLSSPLPFFR